MGRNWFWWVIGIAAFLGMCSDGDESVKVEEEVSTHLEVETLEEPMFGPELELGLNQVVEAEAKPLRFGQEGDTKTNFGRAP